MRRKWWLFIAAPLALAAFIFIGGEIVMYLWNWLAPALFGWRLITFWQALGLLILCRILFGNIGGHGHGPGRHMRWRMTKNMTEEERERWRQEMRARCGFGESSTGEGSRSGA
jgi:uncharacterized membrane protein